MDRYQIPLRMETALREPLESAAKAADVSVNQFIVDCIREKLGGEPAAKPRVRTAPEPKREPSVKTAENLHEHQWGKPMQTAVGLVKETCTVCGESRHRR